MIQPTRLNLIYHLAPFASNDIWVQNVIQLKKRLHHFNNKRIISIMTGNKMVPPDIVKEQFKDFDITFIQRPNDPRQGERVSFPILLNQIVPFKNDEATFYAHTKGVTLASKYGEEAIMYWRNYMYHTLLDDIPTVLNLLTTYSTVGCFRCSKRMLFPDYRLKPNWHFPGTFFWFRNDRFFKAAKNKPLPKGNYSIEAYPGLIFNIKDSYCIGPECTFFPYDPTLYPDEFKICD